MIITYTIWFFAEIFSFADDWEISEKRYCLNHKKKLLSSIMGSVLQLFGNRFSAFTTSHTTSHQATSYEAEQTASEDDTWPRSWLSTAPTHISTHYSTPHHRPPHVTQGRQPLKMSDILTRTLTLAHPTSLHFTLHNSIPDHLMWGKTANQ